MDTRFFAPKLTQRLFLAATTTALLIGCGTAPVADAQTADAPPTTETKAATPPQVGDTAPDFELEAIGGEKVKLSETLKQGPVVLVMLRGFPGYQCPICTMQVGHLMGKADEFKAAKANVILIYPGPADGLKAHAEEFVKGKNIPANFNLLLDPDFSFTNQYGLRWNAKNETAYPATFVLNDAGEVLFAKVSHEHGDRAKVEDVLAALPK